MNTHILLEKSREIGIFFSIKCWY